MVEHQVLGFQVTMDDVVVVQVLKGQNDTGHEEL
jgi:hypothetical protein